MESTTEDGDDDLFAEEKQSVEIARCERMFEAELKALVNEFRYEAFVTYGQIIGALYQMAMDLHLESRSGNNDRDTFDSD